MATINLFPNDTVQVDTLVDENGTSVGGKVNLEQYTTSEALAISNKSVGDLIYVTDGNEGLPTIAIWDGGFWRALTTTPAAGFNQISDAPPAGA